ncbi:MAG: TatD family hydrolase [Parcubacteria group bacterium]|nr:TatD family hydrolase [Parcubacteria group bacterium]
MKPKLIDAHTHVQFAAYQDDVDEVIKRSLAAGIWLVNVGTQLDTSRDAIALAEKHPEGVYATVGLHPIHTDKSFHDKQELGEEGGEFTSRGEVFNYEAYKQLAQHPKVVAIGECGLDYYRSAEFRKKQEGVFVSQIELAQEVKKPLMIHCRQAFDDLLNVLRDNRHKLQTVPGIIHFFSGDVLHATKLLDMGFYFTFGGVVTFSRDYDEIVKTVPLNHIMLETDAPYVTPAPHRGKRNEPSYLPEIAKKLAEIKGVDLEEIAHHTTENAMNIFKI